MRFLISHPKKISRAFLFFLAVGLSLSAQAGSEFPPAFEDVRLDYSPSERVLLDRRGLPLDEKRVDAKVRRLEWTKLAEVSPAFREALLKSEDKRFFDHDGVDWLALGSSLIKMPWAGKARGASTISMQLTQFLIERKSRSSARSITEKLDQIRSALALERSWNKDQILEAYLNLVSFRGELQGLRAASKGLFQKSPHGLSTLESALLAVLIRSPNSTPERVAERVCWLEELRESACVTAREFVLSSLSRPYQVVPYERLAPVLASKLLLPTTVAFATNGERRPESRELRTTLDSRLQRQALELLKGHLEVLKRQNVLDGAVLVLDNKTGDVLAYVANGGSNYSSAPYVDGILARRQAGSTLKPFLYATAIEKRLLTPVSLLEDSPSDFDLGNGTVYRPRNYDNRFHGLITAREALGSSLNVPAVRTLLMIGEASALDKLERLGFSELRESGYYGPSLALGTLDVSLLELTNAYRALSQGGFVSPPKISLDPGTNSLFPGTRMGTRLKKQKVVSEAAAYLVSDMLSDREARRLSFGLESPLGTRHWTAVKTGTSKDMRDNWCIGFSRRYTVGVWVGNFRGEPMWDVSGVSGAAPLWLEIMRTLHENSDRSQDLPPPSPKGVSRAHVTLASGIKTSSFFLSGTEPRAVDASMDAKMEIAPPRSRIVYPVRDLIIAIDPEIPERLQKVPFEANPSQGDALEFHLDGKLIGAADAGHLWSPSKGSHTLELKNRAGRTLDQVSFSVR